MNGTLFWQGCEAGELRLARCGACGRAHHFAPRLCPACLSPDLSPFAASGRGTLASYTIVHRAPLPELRDEAPYALALVDLEEGARMMARLEGAAEAFTLGARVRVTFPARKGQRLPTFVLEEKR